MKKIKPFLTCFIVVAIQVLPGAYSACREGIPETWSAGIDSIQAITTGVPQVLTYRDGCVTSSGEIEFTGLIGISTSPEVKSAANICVLTPASDIPSMRTCKVNQKLVASDIYDCSFRDAGLEKITFFRS